MHERLQALLDRHDVSQQVPQYDAPPHVIVPDTTNIEHALKQISKLTQQQLTQICLTDRETPQSRLENFPVPGACRYIVMRAGEGGDYTLTANTPLLILEANESRIGSQFVNVGAAAVKLYLRVDLQSVSGVISSAATPIIGLSAGGGAWDGRINEIPWCGNVIAVAGTGGSEITVAAF